MLLEERREKNRRGKTEEKNKPKDLPGKTRGKRCLVLSTPTLRSKTAKQRQREKTYPVRRVSSTFFRERAKKKTFRVATDTLNIDFFSFLEQKGDVRGLIRFVHETDLRGLPSSFCEYRLRRKRGENTNTTMIKDVCLCKKERVRFVVVNEKTSAHHHHHRRR